MRYRNVKTGSIIDVPSTLKGDWAPVEEPQPLEKEPAQEKKKATRKRAKKAEEA